MITMASRSARSLRRGALLCGALAAAVVPSSTVWAQAAGSRARAASSCAKDSITVPASGRTLLDDRITMSEARAVAMREAMAEAVRVAVGTRIDAQQQRVAMDAGKGGLVDSYVSIVSGTARGRVIDTRDVTSKIEPEGRVSFMVVSLTAVVACEQGEPDYAFKLDMTTDRPTYVVRGNGNSDAVIASIRSTKDAYVSLFWVTEDSVQLIWPNDFDKDGKLAAGVRKQFPPPSLQKTLKLEPELPPGKKRSTESLIAVATTKPIPWDGTKAAASASHAETAWGNMHSLNRWLAAIPVGSRAIATVTFRIEAADSEAAPPE